METQISPSTSVQSINKTPLPNRNDLQTNRIIKGMFVLSPGKLKQLGLSTKLFKTVSKKEASDATNCEINIEKKSPVESKNKSEVKKHAENTFISQPKCKIIGISAPKSSTVALFNENPIQSPTKINLDLLRERILSKLNANKALEDLNLKNQNVKSNNQQTIQIRRNIKTKDKSVNSQMVRVISNIPPSKNTKKMNNLNLCKISPITHSKSIEIIKNNIISSTPIKKTLISPLPLNINIDSNNIKNNSLISNITPIKATKYKSHTSKTDFITTSNSLTDQYTKKIKIIKIISPSSNQKLNLDKLQKLSNNEKELDYKGITKNTLASSKKKMKESLKILNKLIKESEKIEQKKVTKTTRKRTKKPTNDIVTKNANKTTQENNCNISPIEKINNLKLLDETVVTEPFNETIVDNLIVKDQLSDDITREEIIIENESIKPTVSIKEVKILSIVEKSTIDKSEEIPSSVTLNSKSIHSKEDLQDKKLNSSSIQTEEDLRDKKLNSNPIQSEEELRNEKSNSSPIQTVPENNSKLTEINIFDQSESIKDKTFLSNKNLKKKKFIPFIIKPKLHGRSRLLIRSKTKQIGEEINSNTKTEQDKNVTTTITSSSEISTLDENNTLTDEITTNKIQDNMLEISKTKHTSIDNNLIVNVAEKIPIKNITTENNVSIKMNSDKEVFNTNIFIDNEVLNETNSDNTEKTVDENIEIITETSNHLIQTIEKGQITLETKNSNENNSTNIIILNNLEINSVKVKEVEEEIVDNILTEQIINNPESGNEINNENTSTLEKEESSMENQNIFKVSDSPKLNNLRNSLDSSISDQFDDFILENDISFSIGIHDNINSDKQFECLNEKTTDVYEITQEVQTEIIPETIIETPIITDLLKIKDKRENLELCDNSKVIPFDNFELLKNSTSLNDSDKIIQNHPIENKTTNTNTKYSFNTDNVIIDNFNELKQLDNSNIKQKLTKIQLSSKIIKKNRNLKKENKKLLEMISVMMKHVNKKSLIDDVGLNEVTLLENSISKGIESSDDDNEDNVDNYVDDVIDDNEYVDNDNVTEEQHQTDDYNHNEVTECNENNDRIIDQQYTDTEHEQSHHYSVGTFEKLNKSEIKIRNNIIKEIIDGPNLNNIDTNQSTVILSTDISSCPAYNESQLESQQTIDIPFVESNILIESLDLTKFNNSMFKFSNVEIETSEISETIIESSNKDDEIITIMPIEMNVTNNESTNNTIVRIINEEKEEEILVTNIPIRRKSRRKSKLEPKIMSDIILETAVENLEMLSNVSELASKNFEATITNNPIKVTDDKINESEILDLTETINISETESQTFPNEMKIFDITIPPTESSNVKILDKPKKKQKKIKRNYKAKVENIFIENNKTETESSGDVIKLDNELVELSNINNDGTSTAMEVCEKSNYVMFDKPISLTINNEQSDDIVIKETKNLSVIESTCNDLSAIEASVNEKNDTIIIDNVEKPQSTKSRNKLKSSHSKNTTTTKPLIENKEQDEQFVEIPVSKKAKVEKIITLEETDLNLNVKSKDQLNILDTLYDPKDELIELNSTKKQTRRGRKSTKIASEDVKSKDEEKIKLKRTRIKSKVKLEKINDSNLEIEQECDEIIKPQVSQRKSGRKSKLNCDNLTEKTNNVVVSNDVQKGVKLRLDSNGKLKMTFTKKVEPHKEEIIDDTHKSNEINSMKMMKNQEKINFVEQKEKMIPVKNVETPKDTKRKMKSEEIEPMIEGEVGFPGFKEQTTENISCAVTTTTTKRKRRSKTDNIQSEDKQIEEVTEPIRKRQRKSKIDITEDKEQLKTDIIKNQNLICGKCEISVDRKMWKKHVIFHNGIAWIKDKEEEIDIKNDRLILKLMLAFMKDNQISILTCEKCGEERKSAAGMISHQLYCGLTAEQKIRVNCKLCNVKMMKYSMANHLAKVCHVIKRRATEEEKEKLELLNKDEGDDTEIFNNSGRLKRKSVKKAQKIIANIAKSTTTDDLMDEIRRKKCTAKFTLRWHKAIKEKGIANCYNEKCTFTSTTAEDMIKHYQTCELIPDISFLCRVCKHTTKNKLEMEEHINEMHQDDLNSKLDFVGSDSEASVGEVSSDSDGDSGEDEKEISEPDVESENDEFDKNDIAEVNSTGKSVRIRSGKDDNYLVTETWKSMSFDYHNYLKETQQKPYFSLATEWTIKFRKINYSIEPLFTTLVLPPSYRVLNQSEYQQYLPKTKRSINFYDKITLNYRSKYCSISPPPNWNSLKTFEGQVVNGNQTLFCGGPIIAMEWATFPPDYNGSQYLAVCCKTNIFKDIKIYEKNTIKSLIQIWDMGIMLNKHNLKSPKYKYGIIFDNGPILQIKFCPSGGYFDDGSIKSRLGLLSVSSSIGKVYLYSLPIIKDNSYNMNDDDKLIIDLKPFAILDHDLDDRKKLGVNQQITKICWSQSKGHSTFAAGYGNGMIAIWNINTESLLLCHNINEIRTILPISVFQPFSASISVLNIFYANNSKWLMACSGRGVKLFDVQSFWMPKEISTTLMKTIISCGEWPLHWPAFIIGHDEGLALTRTGIIIIQPNECGFSTTMLNSVDATTTDLTYNEFLNITLAVTDSGDIIAHYSGQLLYSFGNSTRILRMMLGFTEVVDLLKSDTSINNNNNNNQNEIIYPNKYGIIFCDMNNPVQSSLQSLKVTNYRRPPLNEYPITRISQIKTNPNEKSCKYYAIGYQMGIIRIRFIKPIKK